MAIAEKVKDYLDQKHVAYQILEHSLAFTAMEIAGAQHIPGKQLIKAVIVKADNKYLMCVLPSDRMINFDSLKKITQSKDIFLASEAELKKLFPGYEIGTEPPFGDLFGLEVFVDRTVSENEEIVFNAGTHTDTVKIKYCDFKKLTKSTEANFSMHI